MILTENNLKEWKAELSKIAEPYFGENFANCVSDEEYLNDYLDEDTQDVLWENINCI